MTRIECRLTVLRIDSNYCKRSQERNDRKAREFRELSRIIGPGIQSVIRGDSRRAALKKPGFSEKAGLLNGNDRTTELHYPRTRQNNYDSVDGLVFYIRK